MSETGNKGKRIVKGALLTLYAVLVLLALIFSFAVKWLLATWASLSYDEILYHLKAPLSGTNPKMIVEAVLRYVFPLLLIVAALVVVLVISGKKKKLFPFILVGVLASALFLAIYSGNKLDKKTGFISGLRTSLSQKEASLFIEDLYVDPAKVDLKFPKNKRNLIYIYLESMEMTFADLSVGGAFDSNLIPNLTKYSLENINFSKEDSELNGAYSLPGTDWTMGGMFAQTAGVPLKIPLSGNAMETSNSFFPHMTTLGDILASNGYNQVLAIGSEARFGGREIYFESHGNYEIHDYLYDIEKGRIPSDYYVWWGVEDEKLFEYAKEELTYLASENKPFNYTMLTVDSHFEDGYVCRLCKDEHNGNQYANVMSCSDRQVCEFVDWIKEQDFYENTTIILCGDHPTMDADFCDNVSAGYGRRTYTAIINPASSCKEKAGRVFSTIDMFPTTLAAMGVDIPGGKLGLGTNLFSEEKTIVEEFGYEECVAEFKKPSEFLERESGLVFNEEVFREMKPTATLEFDSSNETVVVKMLDMYWLNSDNIQKFEVAVTDLEANKTYKYDLEKIHLNGDPYIWWGEASTDIPSDRVDALTANVSLTIGKITDNEFASIPHNPVYRMYSETKGRHFFTADTKEVTKKASEGWKIERIAWENEDEDDIPIYCVWSKENAACFFTKDERERDEYVIDGWEDAGIAFYAPVYSDYAVHVLVSPDNPYEMIYSTDNSEIDNLSSMGWLDYGVMFYVSKLRK